MAFFFFKSIPIGTKGLLPTLASGITPCRVWGIDHMWCLGSNWGLPHAKRAPSSTSSTLLQYSVAWIDGLVSTTCPVLKSLLAYGFLFLFCHACGALLGGGGGLTSPLNPLKSAAKKTVLLWSLPPPVGAEIFSTPDRSVRRCSPCLSHW